MEVLIALLKYFEVLLVVVGGVDQRQREGRRRQK
jgi:hypothetical protein